MFITTLWLLTPAILKIADGLHKFFRIRYESLWDNKRFRGVGLDMFYRSKNGKCEDERKNLHKMRLFLAKIAPLDACKYWRIKMLRVFAGLKKN